MFGLGSIIKGAISAANKTSSSSSGIRYPSSSGSSSSSSSNSSANTYTPSFYAKTDYQAKINDAVSNGDYKSAAQYEQLRNQKIDAGYGGANQKTNKYSGYLTGTNYNNVGMHGNTDWSQLFKDNMSTANAGQLQNILNQRLDKLGGKADSWQNQAQNYVDGIYSQMYQPSYDMINDYQDSFNSYMDEYKKMQDAIEQKKQANIDQNIANLNAQKNGVYQAGQSANSAAQQNYMDILNPNGANAEQLAALGLTNSGLSESAAISAQNAYTNAINSNEQNVSNQIQAIELAIQNARLSGDIATAEQLQSYYNTVLQAGMQNANNILSANQWAITNGQNQMQQNISNAFNQAGLTGSLNGNNTMQGQQLSYTIEGLSLENQLKQFQLLLQKAYGYQQAEAQLEAQKLANSGASLANTYQQLYNQYLKNSYNF